MQLSTPPTLVPLPFADGGAKNVIPENPSATPGLASLQLGFPPVTMTPLAAGGIPPAGQDMNGVLNLITQSIRWANAGGGYKYNSAFATDSNVNGYPQGAVLLRSDGMGYWLNLADNNTTDPEGSTPANWAPLESYGITAVTGLTNANVTLTPAQYGLSIITLAGTLTGNVQIIFPALKSQWKIVNATTGAFTVTCKTASGTGVIVNQGGEANVYGDGTNIVLNALQIAPATASNQAMSLGQATGRVIAVRTFTSNTTYTPTSGTNAIDVLVVGGGGCGGSTSPTASGQISVASGGAAGAAARSFLTSGFAGQAITVGAGGVGSAGTSGGSSSFGTLLSAAGGTAGGNGVASPPVYLTTPSVTSSIATGGNLFNASGQVGGPGFAMATTSFLSGQGAPSILGAGAPGRATTTGGGNSAVTAGSGGGGALAGGTIGTIQTGGNGAAGIVIITEYS